MNLAQTLRKLLRRWYILLAGLLLAGGAVVGVWMKVPPRFERSSTQVLLPGRASLPQGGQNPYLFIGGLTLAADVVVRAVGSENVAKELAEAHPGIEIEVSRDPSTAGPVILITVGATSDDEAAVVLQLLNQRTAAVLSELQQDEAIPARERMTVVTVTMDQHGTLKDRTRLIVSAAAGVGTVVLSVLVAALVEGLAGRRERRRSPAAEAPTGDGTEEVGEGDQESQGVAREEPASEPADSGDASASGRHAARGSQSGASDGEPNSGSGPAGRRAMPSSAEGIVAAGAEPAHLAAVAEGDRAT